MEIYRCVNCMREMEKFEKICPHCGFPSAEYVQPPNALKKDTILSGRYQVGRVLGQGGFGITYVGYDLKLELKVAIKEYFPGSLAGRDCSKSNNLQWSFSYGEYKSWETGIQNFLSEARKMARLDELEGIVRVRDSFQENQTAYIVMDFAEGVTLKKYLEENGKMDYRTCVQLLLPLMENLEIMHSRGMIHRDISPDNIMVRKKGRDLQARLLDFGAAIYMSTRHSGQTENIVKRGYSAPEQYMENGSIGRWTDVYAMAAVIYRCVSGEEVPEATERIMKNTKLTLDGIHNKKVQEILAKALALKISNRTASMAELSEALQSTLPKSGLPIKRIVAAAAAVVVCVIGISVYNARPWLPTVEKLGCSNSNLNEGSNYMTVSDAGEYYEYYVDKDWNLYISKYDEEAGTFYINGLDSVDSEAGCINAGKDSIYYIHDNEEEPGEMDAIIRMDFDGSNAETLLNDNEYFFLQYVLYDNGKEMLYYLEDNGDEDDLLYTLCRYDMDKGQAAEILDEDIYWYNIDGEYIYYVTFTSEQLSNGTTEFKRAYLNGENEEILNDTDVLTCGFIEGGTAWMMSWSVRQILPYDLEGNQLANSLGEYAEDLYSADCFVYGDGWIYYSPSDSGELHKIRVDGTGETTIWSGDDTIMLLNYSSQWLWVLTGDYDDTAENGYVLDGAMLINMSGERYILIE